MTTSIHQPNFFPWLGYFYKIVRADHFVFLDDVQLSPGSYTLRSRITDHSNKPVWINAPLLKSRFPSNINSVEIDAKNWNQHLVTKIMHIYSDRPCFPEVFPWLKTLLVRAAEKRLLSNANAGLIIGISSYLGIDSQFHYSSKLNATGSSSEYLSSICRELDCNKYLSGPSTYLDHVPFDQNGIEVKKINHLYFQQENPLITPGHSILDALFSFSADSIRNYILKDVPSFSHPTSG